MSKNIIIYGADHYNGNRGVGALLISALYIFEQLSDELKIDFNYTIINTSFHIEYDDVNIGNKTVSIRNAQPIELFSIKGIAKVLLSPSHRKTFKAVKESDYFFNIGEGDSFADIYGVLRFNRINNQSKLAMLFNKKLCLLPQTIGPFKNDKIRKIANKTINRSKVVFPRDTKSFDYIVENTNNSNNFEIVDMAFLMPFKKKEFKKNYTHVGINISGLMWHGGYTKNNQFDLKVNYKELITSVIDYFLEKENVMVHIIPHVVAVNNIVENDYSVGIELSEKYNTDKLVIAPFFLDPIMAKSYIAGLDFFTGARMHSCIAAFSSRVPVIPMAYSRKFNGLFVDTLDYKFLADMVNSETKVVFNEIIEGFDNRENLKSIIEERMDNIVQSRAGLLKAELKKFLEL